MLDLIAAQAIDATCIAITGAGGKTSLLQGLSVYLAANGRPVVLCTSTRILPPNDPKLSPLTCQKLLLEADWGPAQIAKLAEALLDCPASDRRVCISKSQDNGKLAGLPGEVICEITAKLRAKPGLDRLCVIVEADGAACKPLKAHAPHEPSIPPCANLTIAVAGLDALGQNLATAVHRPELAAQRLGLSQDNLDYQIQPEDLAKLLLHPQGAFKNSPGSRAIVLNKADLLPNQTHGQAVQAVLAKIAPGIPCHLTSLSAQLQAISPKSGP